ncbi:MAG: AAA family ATPase [Treponema sp.]|nr:AAA family ATPase [Treponema sp.]
MQINASQLYFILEHTPAEQNIMLVGKHGIGKSRILEDFFAGRGEKVVTLFLGQMSDPGDLIGLPHLDEAAGRTDFMLPYWFPKDGKPVVLFLDELNRARPEVLQTVMDLTLNRKLAGKSLPVGSRIISAVNGGNEYQLTELDPALVSRFNIYEFAPSVEDWLNWARSASIDSRIISFISSNPEYLDSDSASLDSENAGLTPSPDRRSWERTSKIISSFEVLDSDLLSLVAGIIGMQAAGLFFRFINDNSLPSAKSLLCEGEKKNLNLLENLSLPKLCLVNESLFHFIEGASWTSDKSLEKSRIAENLEAYFDFITEKLPKEVSAHFISLCSAKKTPETLNFITENRPSLYRKLLASVSDL